MKSPIHNKNKQKSPKNLEINSKLLALPPELFCKVWDNLGLVKLSYIKQLQTRIHNHKFLNNIFYCSKELIIDINDENLIQKFNPKLITKVAFTRRGLPMLDYCLTNWKNIQELNTTNTGLTSLPESIGNLTRLQILYLTLNSNLTSLPESIGKLTSLQVLHLHGNKLTSLPELIGKLTSLEYLDLHDNKLTSLPVSIGKLINLQKLILNYNQLTSLPESIGKLTNLQYLDLHENTLTSLPESIGKLTNLQELHIDTKIINLPCSIRKIQNLSLFQED